MIHAALPEDEEERLAILRSYAILDTEPEEPFDDITQLAKYFFDMPIVLVSLVDANRQWFKSCIGLDVRETSRDIAFCSHAILGTDVFEIPDASKDERFFDNPLVIGPPHIRFYAGAPLKSSSGQMLGTLCIIDTRPRLLSAEERKILTMLARQVVSQMDFRKLLAQVSQVSLGLEDARIAAQEARQVAETANMAKSSFLSNMSHELRTPLNAIIGYSEMLAEEAVDVEQPQVLEDLNKIQGSAKHLLGLIQDILDLSKIESGKMDTMAEDFSVREMLDEVTSTVTTLIKKNNNVLSVEYENIDISMHSDRQKIIQILFNLLSNAAKFTSDGEIKLTARSVETSEGISSIKLAVTDNGIGINSDKLEQVFSSFNQADCSITKKYGGAGLGLAISQQFCQMLGGQIKVNSEIGKGSEFTVLLPVGLV